MDSQLFRSRLLQLITLPAFRLNLNRSDTGGGPFYFKAREGWFGGSSSQYYSTAWAARLAAAVVGDDPEFSQRLRDHAANQVHCILGMNALGHCMFEGKGNSRRIYYHHMYAEIPRNPRGGGSRGDSEWDHLGSQ